MAAKCKKACVLRKTTGHSVEEGRAMVNAVKRNNMVLQTASMQLSNANFRTACELVRNGYLGDIKEALVNVGNTSNKLLPAASADHQQNWIDSIKNNTTPMCDVETGHRTSSVCCLANTAYWLNRPLKWDPANERFKKDREANRLLKAPLREPWKLN
jgi:hypothetical protein